ncbi:universal stress protein [Zhouia spongiae]|uniref:Universal stress protein n=1 Tax=Zhouia spongiae TaxID=2202721 RepID=A0ABY3YI40_9FLAO|nr:universal stress protein [Zhouia spongiae]UNY97288.1 universal stress protein [Zhouia spongiae]
MKNILIPTDFSPNSWNAITYGVTLFKKEKCNFYLLHVENVRMYADTPGSRPESEGAVSTRERLKMAAEQIRGQFPEADHNFASLVDYDFLVEAIKKQVAEKSIDLIVMGTRGASGIKKNIVGSHTSDVITRVKCPVLAIPEGAVPKVPKEIAFPTDFRIFYSPDMLSAMLDIARLHHASVRSLHAVKEHFEGLDDEQLKNKELLDDHLDSFEHSFHKVTGKRLDKAVQCFTESRDIDIIAMVAKNLNFFQQILFKPTVKEISYHTSIPFLVLHEHAV